MSRTPAAALVLISLVSPAAFAADETEQKGADRKPTGAQTASEVRFESKCRSPELPLDGAPIPALSLDPKHDNTFVDQPPHHARPGTTKLQLLVNEEGRVVRALVAVSQGDPGVDEWIARGVESWRFKPRTLDGKSVCAWGNYSVTFQLADRAADDAAQTQTPTRPR